MSSGKPSRIHKPSALPKPTSRPTTPARFIGYPTPQSSRPPLPPLSATSDYPIPVRKSSIPAPRRHLEQTPSRAEMLQSRRKNSIFQESSTGRVSLIRSVDPKTQSPPPATPTSSGSLRPTKSTATLRSTARRHPASAPEVPSPSMASQQQTQLESFSQLPRSATRPTLLRPRPSLPALSNPPLRRPSDPSITRFPPISSSRLITPSTKTPVKPLRIIKTHTSMAVAALRQPRSRSHSSGSRDSFSTHASSSPTTTPSGSDYSNTKWDPETILSSSSSVPSSSSDSLSPCVTRSRPAIVPRSGNRGSARTNITVFVRIRRPVHLPRPGQSDFIRPLSQGTIEIANNPTGPRTNYNFDHVFGPEVESQEEIYHSLLQKNDLVQGFLEGLNATLIAYGQTSAGKSYTMGTGPASGPRAGIIPRALDDIFHALETGNEDQEWVLELAVVRVAFLEVYNDELGDLLSNSAGSGHRTPAGGRSASPGPISGPIHIREEKGGGISWTGLREVSVKNATEALEQLQIGLGRRATNSTEMNAQSSRSHAIFSVMLDQQLCKNDEKMRRKSKFNFVDLAGSERVSKTKNEVRGERFKEGIAINSGLHALGNVISALSSNGSSSTQQYIPYRESKLTRLLQDSLGGNSNTAMIACVSPEHSNCGETVSTLRYASRTREIKNKPTVTEERAPGPPLSDAEREELRRLRAEVESLRRAGPARSPADLSQSQRQQEFEEAIRPVVEEYEKSLSTLELELVRVQNQLSASLLELSLLRHEKSETLYQIDEE